MGPEELQLTRVSRDTQSRELRFRVLLAEGGARRVNLIRARRSSSEHSGKGQVPARIAPVRVEEAKCRVARPPCSGTERCFILPGLFRMRNVSRKGREGCRGRTILGHA